VLPMYDLLAVLPGRWHNGRRWEPAYLVHTGDEAESGRFYLVEWFDRRLVCSCDEGRANYDEQNGQNCVHLEEVVAHRMNEVRSSRPPMRVDPAVFVE
jgi:hypothetical protein